MRHKRLFIPGPTEVRQENLAALAQAQVGHRSAEFGELYQRVVPKLKQLLETKGRVFLFSSSSTGVWEAAIRNCVRERVLCCMQGAFSDRSPRALTFCRGFHRSSRSQARGQTSAGQD